MYYLEVGSQWMADNDFCVQISHTKIVKSVARHLNSPILIEEIYMEEIY
jgi:hypothetical protein